MYTFLRLFADGVAVDYISLEMAERLAGRGPGASMLITRGIR